MADISHTLIRCLVFGLLGLFYQLIWVMNSLQEDSVLSLVVVTQLGVSPLCSKGFVAEQAQDSSDQ